MWLQNSGIGLRLTVHHSRRFQVVQGPSESSFNYVGHERRAFCLNRPSGYPGSKGKHLSLNTLQLWGKGYARVSLGTYLPDRELKSIDVNVGSGSVGDHFVHSHYRCV